MDYNECAGSGKNSPAQQDYYSHLAMNYGEQGVDKKIGEVIQPVFMQCKS